MLQLMQRSVVRMRRLWVTEALLVAAILVFGGYALLSDARMTPAELLAGVSDLVSP
ncbi:MAG TPA: hypothetical protein VHA07_13445 [Devosia sp.]|nr:hypothetical protein [Devosia sp.]